MSVASTNSLLVPGAAAVCGTATAQRDATLQVEVLLLFDGFRDRLLRYSLSFGLPVPDAEDVLQEVFLALFRHLQAEKSQSNLPGWMYRTTHNLSLKRRTALQQELRRAEPACADGANVDVMQRYPDAMPGPEEQVLFQERQCRLRAVVQALPELDRTCLQLRAEGCRYREIAGITGISLGSVAASLARTFDKLLRIDAR